MVISANLKKRGIDTMNKRIFVSDLSEYFTKQIEEAFFVRDIDIRRSSGQKEYLFLLLQDKTGLVGAIMWKEYLKEEFLKYKGCAVMIKGMVLKNQQEQNELLITSIIPVEDYKQGEFVNGLTEEDTKKFLEYLHSYIENVQNKGYRTLLQQIFNKEENLFATLPVTLKGHHCYNGGLLVHTISVTSLVRYMSRTLAAYNYHPSYRIPYDSSLLVTAGLLHAIGIVKMIMPFPDLKRDNTSILLSLHEHTLQYMQEKFLELEKGTLSAEEKMLLIHTIGCVYESVERKPMLREALLLREAYQLLISVSNLEYFMSCHAGEEGSIFDEQMSNYLYLQAAGKEDTNANE